MACKFYVVLKSSTNVLGTTSCMTTITMVRSNSSWAFS